MKRFFNEWKTTIGTGGSLVYFGQSIKDEKAYIARKSKEIYDQEYENINKTKNDNIDFVTRKKTLALDLAKERHGFYTHNGFTKSMSKWFNNSMLSTSNDLHTNRDQIQIGGKKILFR